LNVELAADQKEIADKKKALSAKQVSEARKKILDDQEAAIKDLKAFLLKEPFKFIVPAPTPLTADEASGLPPAQHQQAINRKYINKLTAMRVSKEDRMRRSAALEKVRLREEEEKATALLQLEKVAAQNKKLLAKLKDMGVEFPSSSEESEN
jgi:hypothetical protein